MRRVNAIHASSNGMIPVREDHIATSWVVAKPTKAGTVRSLELFDQDGETIALVFRKRDDRELAEDENWVARLAALEAG